MKDLDKMTQKLWMSTLYFWRRHF